MKSIIRKKGRLPNPIPLPAWIQTLMWAIKPDSTLNFFGKIYPEFFTVKMVGGRTYMFMNTPKAVKELFVKFPSVSNEEIRPFMGDKSLFLLKGDEHISHRKSMSPHYHGDKMRQYAAIIAEETKSQIALLSEQTELEIYPFVQKISMNIIVKNLFDFKEPEKIKVYTEALREMIATINGPVMFFKFMQKDYGALSPGRKVQSNLRTINKLILEEITRLRQNPDADCKGVLNLLIQSDKNFSDQELIDEVKTILAAGHEPTAAALAWAIYWISSTPGVQEKLFKEISSVEDASNIIEIGMNTQSYLDAICKETLRIVPIVPAIDREVLEPTEFMGYSLLPGDRLVACAYLTHRREEIFENYDRFIPDRFKERTYSPFEYYPFGGGNRRCLGASFAVFQMKIILFSLFSDLSFQSAIRKVKIVQRGATLGPSGYKVKFKRIIKNNNA